MKNNPVYPRNRATGANGKCDEEKKDYSAKIVFITSIMMQSDFCSSKQCTSIRDEKQRFMP